MNRARRGMPQQPANWIAPIPGSVLANRCRFDLFLHAFLDTVTSFRTTDPASVDE
ncbi:MAG: hypothetical protein O3A00_25545 [Planctomycetota bacterium]|nr:hypothetical protein [Planctomycetota bacterium]